VLCDRASDGKEITPHNHRVHNNVATHPRHAQTPGPARLKKNTTTTPPDPTTPPQAGARDTHPDDNLGQFSLWPHSGHAGGASCRSFRAWPEELAALSSRRLGRRPWRARILRHRLRTSTATALLSKARPSLLRRRARAPGGPGCLGFRCWLGRAERTDGRDPARSFTSACRFKLGSAPAFLPPRRRASPSLVAGRYHHALGGRTRRRVAQAGYQYHSLPSLPCSTQQTGRPNHPSPPHRPTPGRRLERKEELRFCAREASPCLARRRKGTSSAGPIPEGSLARKAATRNSGQARRCGGHTGFTCQPPLCLLLSYCLVPCLPHWCPFASVLIIQPALQLRS